MAKKIYALTNIKCNGRFTEAGSEFDTKGVAKETIKNLFDAGALEIRTIEEIETQNDENPTE